MKKLYSILFLIFVLVSCVREEIFEDSKRGESILQDGYLNISFGHESFEPIDISTKVTVPTAAEDAIINMYAIIFDESGNRIYGHYFDSENRCESSFDFENNPYLYKDRWVVFNEDSSKDNDNDGNADQTWGKLKLKAPTDIDNARIYLFGNLDPSVTNMSNERLNIVTKEKDLLSMIVDFNNQSTSRTGNLLMIGYADITIGDNDNSATIKKDNVAISRIELERLDAKIEVKVSIVPGAITTKLNKDGTTYTKQEIQSFSPTSWRVVNLPASSWLMESEDVLDIVGADDRKKEDGYFNSSTHQFEKTKKETVTNFTGGTEQTDVHSFSFYMLESHNSVPDKKKITSGKYNDRDKRVKNDDGTYNEDADLWMHAPEKSPYLVIEGEVQMKVDDQSYTDGKSQTLNALATYYIHLGDFGSDVNNYDIKRGTHYTYNIYIKGAKSIEMEVELDNRDTDNDWRNNEAQSGATGEVYIAQEEIYTFDAHYGQRVFRFNFDAVLRTLGIKVNNGIIQDYDGALNTIADDLTWYVVTPFGKEGIPDRVNGNIEIPTGLDYEWVYFLKNDLTEKDGKTVYSQKNQWYPGDQWKGLTITADVPNNSTAKGKTLMNVTQLCNYLRRQIANYAMGLENDFDDERNIYITTFVEEFYYDADPISHETRDDLWKEFCNKPMRMMHILCSADISRDGASTATGSVVTIRQRSIQTIYAFDKDDLVEGWGVETVDETTTKDEKGNKDLNWKTDTDKNATNNTSKNNGLYNTGWIWELLDGGSFVSTKQWKTYLNYEVENDYESKSNTSEETDDVRINFLRDVNESDNTYVGTYRTMKYSCMQRNRDNDGDGVIDQDEVKWYIAASEQLGSLFVGDMGLTGVSKFYYMPNLSGTAYKSHIVSSTNRGTNDVEVVWAEEGCSTSSYAESVSWASDALHSIRCVRNLGKDSDLSASGYSYDMTKEGSYPVSPISVVESGTEANPIYTFDLTGINSASRRNIPWTTELFPMDENSENALVYNKFKTGTLVKAGSNASDYVSDIKEYTEEGYSYCPTGYRLPNIREAAIMYYYIPQESKFWESTAKYFAVNSYYSFGPLSDNGTDYYNLTTWSFNKTIITLGSHSRDFRCIQDVLE